MLLRSLGIIVISTTLAACNISGSAQKGPFKSGASVSATQLNSQGVAVNSTTLSSQVEGTQGRFSVDRIRWSGWTELVVTGQYFDEFTNNDSSNPITLNAITNKDRRFDTANINLFTHLATARIRQLIDSGQSSNNAWRNTQTELKELFDLQRVSTNFSRGVEQLDLLRGTGSFRSDNAKLLLFTGAFLATDSVSSLADLTSDFADDGEINGAGANAFYNTAVKAGEEGLLNTLSNNLQAYGVSNPPNSGDMSSLPDWVITDVPVDTVAPVITLNGLENVSIVVGMSYTDEGATAEDNVDGVVEVTVVGESDVIDTSVPDTHIITYSATDAAGNTAIKERTVTVTEAENNSPVADDQSIEVLEDSSANSVTLTATDADGDILTYTVASTPENGSLDGDAPNLTYTPNANFFGTDSFTFTVSDGEDSDTATIIISVTNIAEPNTPPEAIAQSITFDEDTTNNVITLSGTDADVDTTLTFTNTSPSSGSLSGTAPNLSYTPNANFFGTDDFSFTVSDGEASDTATINITVMNVQDSPVATSTSVTVEEDSAENSIELDAVDVDGDDLLFEYTPPSHGALSGSVPNLLYTPEANFSGTDSFSFVVGDGNENFSSLATVTVNVTEVNDLPTVNAGEDIEVLRGETITLSGTADDSIDPAGSIVSYRWTGVGINSNNEYATTASFDLDTAGFDLGELELMLTVTDNSGATASDIVVITIEASTSSVNGLVTLADGSTIRNVSVTATATDGTVVTENSDSSGRFSLTLVANTEYNVQLNADGLADQVTNVMSPADGGAITLNLTMIERNANQDVIDGGITVGKDGASVTASVSQFVDSNGLSVAGTLQVSITPVDISNSASLGAFPGEFSGIPSGQSVDSPIYSLGVVEYEFSVLAADGSVTLVNLDEDESAIIEIPIYDNTYQGGNEIQIGDVIPLWSLNEETGLWDQEGQGVVIASTSSGSQTGLALRATVSHFSWWNCDVSMDAGDALITVEGTNTVGSAIVTADASACDIGWRPSTVETILNLGETSQPSPVPSDCEVCFSAEITYADGSIGTTNEFCVVPSANESFPVTLTAAEEGELNIVANYSDTLDITTLVGYPVERVRLSSLTLENAVTYSISTSGDPLPNGFSLNSLNNVSAEISGITDTAGTYTVVIDGIDDTGLETDSVTIIYKVIDPSTSGAPLFITIPNVIDLPYDFFSSTNYDLNRYNLGGEITEWIEDQNNPLPFWLGLTNDGILTSFYDFGTDASNIWNGTIFASNDTGVDSIDVRVCVGFGCPPATNAPGDFALSANNATANFNFEQIALVFDVTLNQAADEDISFSYTTNDGVAFPGNDFPRDPAIAGIDYIATSGTITIPAGSTSVEISVPIINDLEYEGFEKYLGFTIDNNSSGRIEVGTSSGIIEYGFPIAE